MLLKRSISSKCYPFIEKPPLNGDDALKNTLMIESIIKRVQQPVNEGGYGLRLSSVITDSAGQLEKARKLLRLRWPYTVFEKCWAHQYNRVCHMLMKSFSLTSAEKKRLKSEGKSILNFSDNLKRLISIIQGKETDKESFRACCKVNYDRILQPSVLKPIFEIRWNTVFTCVASVLRHKDAVHQFLTMKDDFFKGSSQPHIVEVANFFANLEEIALLMEPLARMVLLFEKEDNNKSSVLYSLLMTLKKFKTFEKKLREKQVRFTDNGKSAIKATILDIEKRWKKCEQTLYLLCLHLT